MKKNEHIRTPLLLWMFLLLTVPISFSGCEDEDPVIYDFRPISEDFMQTYVTCSALFFYVDQMAKSLNDSLSSNPDGSYQLRGGIVTADPATPDSYPKTFVIDFGGTGTDDIVSGKITGTISALYLSEGSVTTYGYENLIIHRDSPAGTCSITNMGISSGKILFDFKVPHNTLIRDYESDSAYPVTLDGYQQILWSESSDQITMPAGSFEGLTVKYDSLQFTAVVDAGYKLIKDADCSYIRDGIFDFRVRLNNINEQVGDGVVDFGYVNPMECDDYVIAVVDGESNRTEFIYRMDWLEF